MEPPPPQFTEPAAPPPVEAPLHWRFRFAGVGPTFSQCFASPVSTENGYLRVEVSPSWLQGFQAHLIPADTETCGVVLNRCPIFCWRVSLCMQLLSRHRHLVYEDTALVHRTSSSVVYGEPRLVHRLGVVQWDGQRLAPVTRCTTPRCLPEFPPSGGGCHGAPPHRPEPPPVEG